MLEESSQELEKTIAQMQEKFDSVEEEGNLFIYVFYIKKFGNENVIASITINLITFELVCLLLNSQLSLNVY